MIGVPTAEWFKAAALLVNANPVPAVIGVPTAKWFAGSGENMTKGRLPTVETSPAGVVDILSVSPLEEDHDALRRIFECPARAIYTDSRWQLHRSATIKSAVATLQRKAIAVLMCGDTLPPGTWVNMLEYLAVLPEAPSMIVCSRLADARLWGEVLNRGAFDVLAKPFDGESRYFAACFAGEKMSTHGDGTTVTAGTDMCLLP